MPAIETAHSKMDKAGLALPALLALLFALTMLAGCDAAATAGASASAADTDASAFAANRASASTQQNWWWDGLSDSDKSLMSISSYSGDPIVELNGNVPVFDDSYTYQGAFESYSDLDELGRCGVAYACLGTETVSTEARGDISGIHPTGWDGTTYGFVDQEKIFNRSHLIAHSLSGEDANEKNLITGTRYFNSVSMQEYENQVLDYIYSSKNHVLYRVTPVFEGDNLVASGVQMEARSVEDDGAGISFNVYCYNVQPGVTVDYSTGDNWLSAVYGGNTDASGDLSGSAEGDYEYSDAADTSDSASQQTEDTTSVEGTYVVNTKSMKFHLPTCDAVSSISDGNRMDYTGDRRALIDSGYSPCGSCNP